MAAPAIRFEDGAPYDHGISGWSRITGETFLDCLAPQSGLRWIDAVAAPARSPH